MKKIVLLISYFGVIVTYGQKVDTIYINTYNNNSGSKVFTENANIYSGLKNTNYTDFCFLKDSNLLIHDTNKNTFLLVDKSGSIIDQFNYTKKIRHLKYNSIPTRDQKWDKTPFYGKNGNISYINDTTVFVSVIKKRSDLTLFYLTVTNNKIKPIFENMERYETLFPAPANGTVHFITSVFKDQKTFWMSYYTLSKDSGMIYKLAGIGFNTKKNAYLSRRAPESWKTTISNSIPSTSITNFGNSYLVSESFRKKIYQFDQNFNCIDSVNLEILVPDYSNKKILTDVATNNKYIVFESYNWALKMIEYTIYEIQMGLKLKFIKKLSFERITDIKTISNGSVYFPFLNNEDYKYYIYEISLKDKSSDSLIVRYKGHRPPMLKDVDVLESQKNLYKKQKDPFMGFDVDDFIQMKKRECKLFPLVEKNINKYPQSTIKELLESLLIASDSLDYIYTGMYLQMYEKEDYKINFENQQDSLKKRIEDNSIANYSVEERSSMHNILSLLLLKMGVATMTEKDNLVSIQVNIDDMSYIFLIIKSKNEYFMFNRIFKKSKDK